MSETFSSPIARKRRKLSWWTPFAAMGILGILLFSSGLLVSSAHQGASTTAVKVGSGIATSSSFQAPHGAISNPSVRAQQLRAAAASLEDGQGPADGHAARCSSSAPSTSVACDLQPLVTSAPTPGWQELNTPAGRYGATMTYDGADHYVLLFGTGSSNYAAADTWAFAGGSWSIVHTVTAPPARVSPMMAYDPADGYVVLFGGWGGNYGPSEYGDTWTYVKGVWTELYTPTAPSPRDSGAMTWDAKDGYLVLFGDYAGDNDTWTFVAGSWTPQIAPSMCTGPGGPTPCPSGREDEGLTYDAHDGYVLMFGGESSSVYLNDTWSYVGGKWTELISPSTCRPTTCPSARYELSLTYDSADGYVVLFGGYDGSVDLGDTWSFQAGTWTQLLVSGCTPATCPSVRSGAAMTYDPADGDVVLFGGYSQHVDTWSFVGGTWSPVTPNAPSARWSASMAYDPADREVVLFGGDDGSLLQDTWAFRGGSWTPVITSGECTATGCPAARSGSNMTYDAADGYLVLFGGQGAAGNLRDTWKFVGGSWTELIAGSACSPTTCPTARYGMSLAWDQADGYVVLFGGMSGATLQQDTWSFSAGAWTELIAGGSCTATTCPSARAGAGLTYDGADGYLLLFGGFAPAPVNDTWKFNAGGWSELRAPTSCTGASPCPSPRGSAALSYDANLGRVVLFGGMGSAGQLSDTWEFALGQWSSVSSRYPPTARSGAGLVYDGAQGRTLLFGGQAAMPLGDTWSFQVPFFANAPTVSPTGSYDAGQSVVFQATATGGSLAGSPSFYWQGLPAGCSVAGPSPLVPCQLTTNGTYFITVVAIDSDGSPAYTSNFLVITVNPDPVVTLRSSSARLDLGQTTNLTASTAWGSAVVSYAWNGLPPSCVPTGAATVLCTPASTADLGTWTVSASVTDASGTISPPAYVGLTVLTDPTASVAFESRTSLDIGQSVLLSANASGGSAPYAYQWTGLPAGCANDTATVDCRPTGAAGTFTPSVQVRDANGMATAAAKGVPFTIYADPTVSAPSITISPSGGPGSQVTAGTSIVISVTSTAGAGGATYAWYGLPPGCAPASNVSTQVTCAPTAIGSFPISAAIKDSNGVSIQGTTTVLSVVAPAVPPAPAPITVIVGASPMTTDVGGNLTFVATATGGSGPLTYSWTGLPSGCSPANTATLSCTPGQPGSSSITITVSDAGGAQASSQVGVVVYPALKVTSLGVSTTSPVLGGTVTFSVNVEGGSGAYIYSWSGLPAGCPGGNTPTLTCVPSQTGSSAVQVVVTDSTGAAASSPLVDLSVSAAPTPAFDQGANGLDWALFFLVVVAVLLSLLALVLSLRRGREPRGGGSHRPRAEPAPTQEPPAPLAVPGAPASSAGPPPGAADPKPSQEPPAKTPMGSGPIPTSDPGPSSASGTNGAASPPAPKSLGSPTFPYVPERRRWIEGKGDRPAPEGSEYSEDEPTDPTPTD